jgi:hypothetical protein
MAYRSHRSKRVSRRAVGARRDRKLDLIARVPLFAGCGYDALVELGRSFELATVGPDTVLDTEGARARFWWVVVEGCALTTHRGEPAGVVGPGASVGGHPAPGRDAGDVTVRALGPMTLLVTDARALPTLARRHPAVAKRLLGTPPTRTPPTGTPSTRTPSTGTELSTTAPSSTAPSSTAPKAPSDQHGWHAGVGSAARAATAPTTPSPTVGR